MSTEPYGTSMNASACRELLERTGHAVLPPGAGGFNASAINNEVLAGRNLASLAYELLLYIAFVICLVTLVSLANRMRQTYMYRQKQDPIGRQLRQSANRR